MKPIGLAAVLLTLFSGFTGGVAASNNSTAVSQQIPGKEESGIMDLGEQFKEAIASVLMDLVKSLAETLNAILVRIFVSYPDVKQPAVLEIHQDVFLVSLALATAAAVWIGAMHMFDRVDGVRPLVSLLVAVAFGAVAPELLYYPVELSNSTAAALAPEGSNIVQTSRFSFEILLVLYIDVFLLLGTVMIFVARDFYLMLGVALSPLIALMAVTPPFRRYADALTSIWVACLLIGPLNVVVLDLTMALMGSSMMDTPHYLWGLGGIALLFALPLILLGAGAVVFAPMTRVVRGGTKKFSSGVRRGVNRLHNNQRSQSYDRERNDGRNRGNRFRNQGGD
ncbi:hypothetical protein [Halosimplex salinum]|uniref:hypothetical protein n=1 Tax=Halosimplex salinum TaxID=1710538 RepID=UPI0013DDE11E|nr:hypothetical protein [Halosimplex salinum]